MPQPHFLIVTYPARGHINPSLHFAHRLIRATGVRVTFATGVSAFRHSMISKNDRQLPDGLAFLSFPDALEGGADGDSDSGTAVNSSSTDNHLRQIFALKRIGTEALKEFIRSNRDGDSPVTFLVHSLLLTWAAKVAREFHLPSALLWIQPATVFDVYYYNFNGYADVISKRAGHPSDLIEFPKLPPLALRDLPSFVAPSNPYKSAHTAFEEQMECLREETDPKILVNTFDELEPEALTAIPNLKMVAVGPLLPLEIFRRNDNRFPGDSIQVSRDYSYIHWLDSKPESSVIYVSFGTVAVLSKKQLEELARGLIEARRPFLWVITDKPNGEAEEKEIDKISGFRQELDEIGMILSWCSQVEVLKHRAIGCFVTHCGWNSTLETLVLGVPVVAFPRWSDQTTNAKLLEDSWRIGVRVRENEEGVVESGEIRRCVEAVMEEKAAELRENAKKWRDLAAAAGREGGSSDKNIEYFVDEILGESSRRLYETEMEKSQDKSVYTTGQDDCGYSFPN